MLRILEGHASDVAAGIRRSATKRELENRKAADECAQYLLNHKAYLRYDECLDAGFPIATDVIEGACRHVVKDRMDLTGARWSLGGAEAILRLRSLRQVAISTNTGASTNNRSSSETTPRSTPTERFLRLARSHATAEMSEGT